MSETLRDLVVSLSLDSSQFTRNIKSVGKQIADAESAFKLAGAGINNFDKTTAGASAKVKLLSDKLKLQRNIVTQYERALASANTKLTNAYAKQQQLTTSLTMAQDRQRLLKEQVDKARTAYERYKNQLGESNSATIAARQNLERLEEEYTDCTAIVQKLNGQVEANGRYTQSSADSVSDYRRKLNEAKANVRQTSAELQRMNTALSAIQWQSAGDHMVAFGKKITAAGTTMRNTGRVMSRYLTTPIIALAGYAVKTSISMEDAFSGVQKTVKGTAEQLEDINDELKGMTLNKPTDYSSVAVIAENAGQLGIATDAVAGFTSVLTDLGNVSNSLDAETASSELAKFANIMQMEQTAENFSRLGSAIYMVGTTTAATEASVSEMSLRLAGAGKQVGMSEADVVGLAASLSSVGLEAQAGGTAFSKMMIKMDLAAQTGENGLKDFAAISGMTTEQFKQSWETNAVGTIQAFLNGLAQMDEEGESSIAVLDEIGIKEVRLRDALLRATNAATLFETSVATSNKAWKENNALTNEANRRYQTTKNRLLMLRNKAALFGQTLGEDLQPTMERLIEGAGNLLDGWMNMDSAQRQSMLTNALWLAGTGPVLKIFGSLFSTVGKGITNLGKFTQAVAAAGGGMKGLQVASHGLLSPATGIAALTALIVIGAAKLYDYASGAQAAREALDGMRQSAEDWANQQADTVYDNDGMTYFGLSSEDFVRETQDVQTWLDSLLAMWNDGQKDTKEQVLSYADSFRGMNDVTKAALEEIRQNAEAAGLHDMASEAAADLQKLDDISDEMEKLLLKKRNRKLSEKDQVRLQELIDTRQTLEVKYKLTPADNNGFQQILDKVRAAEAQADAQGSVVASNLYATALTAAAQGMSAIHSALDTQYEKEYATIQLLEDGIEKQAALEALNERYALSRQESADKYAETVRQVIQPAFAQSGMQEVQTQVETLSALVTQYKALENAGDTVGMANTLTQMNELTSSMDEGKLASYLTLLTQMQTTADSLGMDVNTIFPELQPESLFGGYSSLAEFAAAHSELSSLNGMLNEAVGKEVERVLIDLDMTAAQTTWNTWASSLSIQAKVDPVLEADRLNNFYANNIVDGLTGYVGYLDFDPAKDDLQMRLQNGTLKIYDGDGLPVPVTPELVGQLDSNDIVMGVDEQGVKHIQIQLDFGSQENMTVVQGDWDEQKKGLFGWFQLPSMGDKIRLLQDYVQQVTELRTQVAEMKDESSESFDLMQAASLESGIPGAESAIIDKLLELSEDPEAIQQISTYLTNAAAALQNGVLTPEQSASVQGNVQALMDVLKASDEYLGVGNQISAGLSEGINQYSGWNTTAETVATDVKNAFTASGAFNIHSPSRAMEPIGSYVSEGLASGMLSYSFDTDVLTLAGNVVRAMQTAFANQGENSADKIGSNVAASVGSGMTNYDFVPIAQVLFQNISTELSVSLNSERFQLVGTNAANGIAQGILNGRSLVTTAMATLSRQALNTAKSSLQIRSPSRVMRDEVGVMIAKGLGEGVQNETKRQARILQNAARFLTTSAQQSISSASYDNRRTYHTTVTPTIQVESLTIQDQQDLQQLAIELAYYTKRQNRGWGA